MTFRTIAAFTILAAIGAGCVGTRPEPHSASTSEADSSLFKKVSAVTEQARNSLHELTRTDKDVEPPRWNWASAVPLDLPRSQMVGATIPADALAFLAPEVQAHNVLLASTHSSASVFRVVNVEGHPVRNCADFYFAAEKAADKGKTIQVDLLNQAAPPGSPETAVEMDANKVIALSQMIAPGQPAMRVTEDGNPWIVLREQGVRCKLTARTERNRGLLHVVISLANSWGEPKLLPAEVRAYCDDLPLRCFSVTETLEVLYGKPSRNAHVVTDADYSFAATSEREDYLIPVNFPRIQEELDEAFRHSILQPVPAFASLPGHSYPGSATLGDARALSGFLMQRQVCRPGDPEHTGWLVFGGESLRDGGTIDITIDLGNGPRRFRFHVPAE